MEMEVMVPAIHNMDFDFNSARSSPMHAGSPVTPRGFGDFYCSAPSSPNRLAQFYREFDDFLISAGKDDDGGGAAVTATVPFDWEEKPGIPKSFRKTADVDFAFDVGSDDWETASLSAEELFDGGVIKALKPPPRLHLKTRPPKSPVSTGKKMISGTFSPRHHRRGYEKLKSPEQERRSPERQRGRERGPPAAGLSSSSRRATRSLSPYRVSQYPWEEEEEEQSKHGRRSKTETEPSPSSIIAKPSSAATTATAPNSAISSALTSFSKKWKLKDFFLFRSASEGRAADKDPLKKYTAAIRRYEDAKISSNSSHGSVRRGRVSAHELHYTMNKAVSDDLRKKTFLPYKQGILGRLAFNPAVHALANGFGISHK